MKMKLRNIQKHKEINHILEQYVDVILKLDILSNGLELTVENFPKFYNLLDIGLTSKEIASDFEKYGIFRLRELENNNHELVIGCGNKPLPFHGGDMSRKFAEYEKNYDTEHSHEGADTINPDITYNPTVVALFGKQPISPLFKGKKYDVIKIEGIAILEPSPYIMDHHREMALDDLIELLSQDGKLQICYGEPWEEPNYIIPLSQLKEWRKDLSLINEYPWEIKWNQQEKTNQDIKEGAKTQTPMSQNYKNQLQSVIHTKGRAIYWSIGLPKNLEDFSGNYLLISTKLQSTDELEYTLLYIDEQGMDWDVDIKDLNEIVGWFDKNTSEIEEFRGQKFQKIDLNEDEQNTLDEFNQSLIQNFKY